MPGGIGISEGKTHSPNDGILYRWQSYAGKFSEKTMDRHLMAIRQFEEFLSPKSFKEITVKDCYAMRENLKASLAPDASEPKSKSSVQHFVSHLKDFLRWLRMQKSYKQLPEDLAGALDLPRSVYAQSLPRKRKAFPSLEEAEGLLSHMPDQSVLDKRNRAIFALAFLGALRADTLISLRLSDIDCGNKKIFQDAHRARTKNSKSLVVAWFPISEAFSDAVSDWIDLMEVGQFGPDDALFPPESAFCGQRNCRKRSAQIVPAMTSAYAVTEAFKVACRAQNRTYTPHAAKHTIAAERDRRQLTAEQRKAWSQNMGHENEQITDTHYGKISDELRFELIEKMPEESHTFYPQDIPDEIKIALVDAIVVHLGAKSRS